MGALWADVVAAYDLSSAEIRTLEVACVAFDRAEAARLILAAEGLVVVDRFGQSRPHPAVKIAGDAGSLWLRASHQVGLEVGE